MRNSRPPPAHEVDLAEGRARALWMGAGFLLTGLALVGAVLPVMPSTVFAIGAAACFSRGSRRFELWLLAHPLLGPNVLAWRRERAIAPKAKALALGSIALSATALALTAPQAVTLGVGAVLAAVALYLVTRPHPKARA